MEFPFNCQVAAFYANVNFWLGVVIVLLLFVIWLLTRHQECAYSEEPPGNIAELSHTLAGLTHGSISEGNSVELVHGAAFFERITEEMATARHSIHLETFLWEKGKASDLVTDALCQAARRGLKVRVLTDARGCSGMGSDTRDRLKEAGCETHHFHRWRLMNLGRFNVRDHRKILVIDGRAAYVGGHCITDAWLEDQENHPVYRDITARFTGPIVNRIQSVFSENWTESEHGLFVDATSFSAPDTGGRMKAHVAYVRPDGCPSSVQVLHYLAISMAEKSIRIQNPYFLPDPSGAEILAKASRRGVDVRIMTPAISATDSPVVAYAGQYLYTRLLEAGVRILEYQPTLLHQKIITVDGVWCGIGSSNFDDRSFEINDEITIGVFDTDLVSELDGIFEKDVADCEELDLEEWKKRSVFRRIRERVFYLFNEQF